jgi:2,3-bisphosphoglycerate-independent phosphoglycerate mutase
MIGFDEIRKLARVTPSKIVLLVIDGIGGLPHPQTGRSALETAHIPKLDRVALEGICGMFHPVSPGITPGSAPGHTSLFGYDPMQYQFGRGIVEALGLDEELDAVLPALLDLKPDVFIVTGDHPTPAGLGMHSRHPVPVVLRERYCRTDEVTGFSEQACLRGSLGQLLAPELLPLAMANALKLNKFGA